MSSQMVDFTPSQSRVIAEHLQRGLILASLRPDPLGDGIIARFVGEEFISLELVITPQGEVLENRRREARRPE